MNKTDRPPRRPSILIADHYLPSALALKDLLAASPGVEPKVHVVEDGHTALAIVQAAPLDVAVLVDGLPDMPAQEVAATLRQRRAQLPTIVAFVAADRQSAAEANASGLFDVVMVQPVDVDLLLEVVCSVT